MTHSVTENSWNVWKCNLEFSELITSSCFLRLHIKNTLSNSNQRARNLMFYGQTKLCMQVDNDILSVKFHWFQQKPFQCHLHKVFQQQLHQLWNACSYWLYNEKHKSKNVNSPYHDNTLNQKVCTQQQFESKICKMQENWIPACKTEAYFVLHLCDTEIINFKVGTEGQLGKIDFWLEITQSVHSTVYLCQSC